MKEILLFEKFQKEYNCCLEFDEFTSVLMMYPAALVANADGDFSHLEKLNIVNALKELASDDEFKLCEMYHLLCQLMTLNIDKKNELLANIKEAIEDKPEIKLIILELMIATAEAEDGISEVEKEVINQLKELLSI